MTTSERQPQAYCKPLDHIWVRVVGGAGYDAFYTTDACLKCHCFRGSRKRDEP